MSIQKYLVPAVTEYIKNNPGVDSVDIVSHFKLRADITFEAVSELQNDDIIIRKELYGTSGGYFLRRGIEMYEVVDDENKAVKLQYKANNTDAMKLFCPLINKQCNPKCVCFLRATIHKNERGKYVVKNGYCNNEMFERSR